MIQNESRVLKQETVQVSTDFLSDFGDEQIGFSLSQVGFEVSESNFNVENA